MSLYGMFKSKGASGFGYGSTAEEVTSSVSLEGKTILVTGCNSGIGFETMRVLALRGAHVLGAARTDEKARSACAAVSGRATGFACELSDPRSVQRCIESVKASGATLDAIICNAGIMRLPKLTQAYGYELQFFTNHIGHFILVNGLLGALTESGRVVMVSSRAHLGAPPQGVQLDNLSGDIGYRPAASYGQSKFANILFAKELARRFRGTARTANAVHPGVIRTGLTRYLDAPRWALNFAFSVGTALVFKTIPQGAATQTYVAAHPAAASISGAYFVDSNVAAPRIDAEDSVLAAKLWDVSEKIVVGLGIR